MQQIPTESVVLDKFKLSESQCFIVKVLLVISEEYFYIIYGMKFDKKYS